MIFQLLGGIVVAAGVFTAVLWSIFQGATKRGWLQYAHIAAAIFSVLGMATVSLVSPILAQITSGALLVSAIGALYFDYGWNRLFPVFQIVFSIALFLGLPFN